MAKSPDDLVELEARLERSGLVCFGALEIEASLCAKGCETEIGKLGLLIGNGGSTMWESVSHSHEYQDGDKDPLNRWTRRQLTTLANEVGAGVVFPFDEPFWAFQKLARKAVGVEPSPLGILIHPQYGLWHAYRGMFVFETTHEFASQIKGMIEDTQPQIHPCETCEDKPCFKTCPVGAFTGERLSVEQCFAHLDSGNNPKCMHEGCQARGACAVGEEYKYEAEQIRHHMMYYRK